MLLQRSITALERTRWTEWAPATTALAPPATPSAPTAAGRRRSLSPALATTTSSAASPATAPTAWNSPSPSHRPAPPPPPLLPPGPQLLPPSTPPPAPRLLTRRPAAYYLRRPRRCSWLAWCWRWPSRCYKFGQPGWRQCELLRSLSLSLCILNFQCAICIIIEMLTCVMDD